MEKDREELMDSDEFKIDPDPKPPHEKKQRTFEEANKTIQLREKLRNMLKQSQADEIAAKENKEKI